VLDLCCALVLRGEAHAVLGNHDAAACGREPAPAMNDQAWQALMWTRARLKPRHQRWLTSLPLLVCHDGMTWVHASALQPEAWTYISSGQLARASLNAAGSNWVFCGHVHESLLFYTCSAGMPAIRPFDGRAVFLQPRRGWLAIVGSAGQPRDGLPGARYALFDSVRFAYTCHRVSYASHETAARIRAAGLPERFARYVEGALLSRDGPP